MPRANLGQLLGNIDDTAPPNVAPEAAVSSPVPEVSVTVSRKPPPPVSAADAAVAGASYLRFVRKDTRLRVDQLEALTFQARRLNRKRSAAGPRVTENTLIRIAVDLLLDRIEKASGEDEAALLGSVRR